jgi:hypothetical protein
MAPLEYNDHLAVRAGGDTGGQVFKLAPRQEFSIGRVSCQNKLLGGCPNPAIGADHDAVVLDDTAIYASLGQRLTIGPQDRHELAALADDKGLPAFYPTSSIRPHCDLAESTGV